MFSIINRMNKFMNNLPTPASFSLDFIVLRFQGRNSKIGGLA